ncbi:MAG: response regulator transcription factor [Phycisphaerae bacterium]
MAATRVVIIEDETAIRAGVAAALRGAGFEPIEAADGKSGLAAARRPGVDLVLLDLMLPEMDGMAVLAELRKTHATLPVIILTARGLEEERVAGLTGGADDYVVKPFSARELLARVAAVLRRSPERPSAVTRLSLGTATIDLERREITADDGRSHSLSETECAILGHLAANPSRSISREELLTRLWGMSGSGIETRTVDMHVARLRSKLSAAAGVDASRCIVTVRGKGYMLGTEADAGAGRSERGRPT